MSDDPNKDQGEHHDDAPRQPLSPDLPASQPGEGEAPAQSSSDADGNLTVPGPRPVSRGAQVRLTGEARDAARGGLSSDMEGNALAKAAMEADGTVADGYSPDGSTRTGKPPADPVVTQEGDPIGDVPATETRVTVEPDRLETEHPEGDKPQE